MNIYYLIKYIYIELGLDRVFDGVWQYPYLIQFDNVKKSHSFKLSRVSIIKFELNCHLFFFLG